MEPDATRDPSPERRAPLPAGLSIGLLVLLIGAAVAFALQHERTPGTEGPARRTVDGLGRDPLTGRRIGEEGRPVPPAAGAWGSAERPLRLRFVPSADREQMSTTIHDLARFLREATGYEIEAALLQSYGLVIQELVQGRSDVAFLTSASYARARWATANDDPDDDLVAVLQVQREGEGRAALAYRGAILVRADAGIETLAGLEGRTVAFGSKTSGAGSILPSALFNEIGLDVEVQRYDGYARIITAVHQGAVDAGAIWHSPPTDDNPRNDARITVRGTLPAVFETTRILAFTSWIPNEPVVMRKAVPHRVRHVLARAIDLYVGMLRGTAEGRRRLEAIGSPVNYVPADDRDFDVVLETVERAFANDPEGLADFKRAAR